MKKKIAILGLKRIGDAVYTLPLIQAVSEQLNMDVVLFTEPQVKDIYEGNSSIFQVNTFPKKTFFKNVLSALKTEEYAACLILHSAFKYALIPFLAQIPVRIGYRKEARGFMLTHKLALSNQPVHRLEHNARLGDLIGVNSRYISPKMYFTQQEKSNTELLKRFDLSPNQYVVLIVGSIAETRRWFPQSFATTAKAIHEKWGLNLIILGGPEDVSIGDDICALVPRAEFIKNHAGETSLRETMLLFLHARAVISNDTGPMHVASAVGTDVITWFGAADEQVIKPNSLTTTVLNAHVSCSPCEKEVCPKKTLECLHKITPDEVIKTFTETVLKKI